MSPTPDSPSTHLTLLEGVRGGEREAWARFFDRYAAVALRWCRQRGVQPADAEDVVQTLMRDAPRKVEAYKRHDDKGNVLHFRPWLRTVVGNLAEDRRRERRRKPGGFGDGGPDHPDAFVTMAPTDTEGIADAIADEYRADVERVVAAVRDRLRGPNAWAIFQAVELAGRPAKDVAAEFGTTTGAVYVGVNRTNKLLKDEYRKLFPDSQPPEPPT